MPRNLPCRRRRSRGASPVAAPGARPAPRPCPRPVPAPRARPAGDAPARLSVQIPLAGHGIWRRDGAEEEGSRLMAPVLAQISSSRVHPFCVKKREGKRKKLEEEQMLKEEEKRNRVFLHEGASLFKVED